jgi:hypothetical protein
MQFNVAGRIIMRSRRHCQMLGMRSYVSKWFYDTFTGAARCGSFVGKAFSHFGCSPRVNVVYTMIYVVQTA